jgi:hypothetical protein
VERKTPSSDQVRDLVDRFLEEAPAAARSVVSDTAHAVVEGLRRPEASRRWLTSPAGMVAIGGGLCLFGAGWMLGRRSRASRPTGLALVAAASAGLAAGVVASATARSGGTSTRRKGRELDRDAAVT